ncbi:WxL protein peptidoglycan domain-containing protein [Paenarthrobacter sp. NPDC091711]|uniref:COG1470 family protein n=1 Tax=Paenarthrobacter sp. NPDC091711 TaxID=3364385 RepID=UPI0037F9814E
MRLPFLGQTGHGHLRRVVVAMYLVASVIFATVAFAPAGFAATGDATDSPVTWAVTPADAEGPDGRSWLELELDSGASANEHLAVRNLSDRDVTFALTAADGYFTPTGRFNMLPGDKQSVAAGTWISMDKTVTVAAGGTAVVPFKVTVPDNATPGDHAAGIAASIYSQGGSDGTQLGVESRVGFRVMTRVKGEVKAALSVKATASYDTSWNPLEPGSADLTVDLENTGNVRLSVDPRAMVNDAQWPAAGTEEARTLELLPGDRRTVSIHVPGVWPLGIMTLPVTVSQGVIAPDGSTQALDPVQESVTLWAIPWPQLAILVALLLLFAGLFWGRRRRKKELVRLLEEAREAGRREVGTP